MDIVKPPIGTITYSLAEYLNLYVYVTGYSKEGESILIVLAEKDIPLLVIVTDSYAIVADNNNNYFCKVHEILDAWGKPDINIFIWTHPHEDHSIGIPELLDSYDPNKNAYIFLPGNLVGYQDHPEIRSVALDAYNWLQHRYKGKNQIIYPGCHQFQPIDQYRYDLICNSEENPVIRFELNFFAPHQQLVANQANNKNFNLNCASLASLISVNGINLFMGADLDSQALKYIPDLVFNDIDLIKIPHHGSNEVVGLVEKFTMNICEDVHSATTIYTNGKDPKQNVIEAYKNLPSIVHFTGPIGSNPTEHNFGCIEYRYDLYKSMLVDVTAVGHAVKL